MSREKKTNFRVIILWKVKKKQKSKILPGYVTYEHNFFLISFIQYKYQNIFSYS